MFGVNYPILSGWTIQHILGADPGDIRVSLDLGLSERVVQRTVQSAILPNEVEIAISSLEGLDCAMEDCFLVLEDGACRKIYIYSEQTRRYYKLFQPKRDVAPTIVIGGATMHTIVNKTPWRDAQDKTAVLRGDGGECLDTCFGLGYSAQLLFKKGFDHLVTCEIAPSVLRIARHNPWSQPVFENPEIDVVPMDVRDFLRDCGDNRFAAIFHDPPTVHQAGELYSGKLYREFHRVIRPRGWLYHYVGDPGGQRGQDFTRGVLRRLQEAGFRRTSRRTGGVLCQNNEFR